jgi:hypothetical protein
VEERAFGLNAAPGASAIIVWKVRPLSLEILRSVRELAIRHAQGGTSSVGNGAESTSSMVNGGAANKGRARKILASSFTRS